MDARACSDRLGGRSARPSQDGRSLSSRTAKNRIGTRFPVMKPVDSARRDGVYSLQVTPP